MAKTRGLKLTLTMSDGLNVVWRITKTVKDKAAFRMGENEYTNAIIAAEKELYKQIDRISETDKSKRY